MYFSPRQRYLRRRGNSRLFSTKKKRQTPNLCQRRVRRKDDQNRKNLKPRIHCPQVPKSLTPRYQDNEYVKPQDVLSHLRSDASITHVACVHSETTSGIINPVSEIGAAIKSQAPNICYIVDAMSSFGAYPIYPEQQGIDYLVASSNKNL